MTTPNNTREDNSHDDEAARESDDDDYEDILSDDDDDEDDDDDDDDSSFGSIGDLFIDDNDIIDCLLNNAENQPPIISQQDNLAHEVEEIPRGVESAQQGPRTPPERGTSPSPPRLALIGPQQLPMLSDRAVWACSGRGRSAIIIPTNGIAATDVGASLQIITNPSSPTDAQFSRYGNMFDGGFIFVPSSGQGSVGKVSGKGKERVNPAGPDSGARVSKDGQTSVGTGTNQAGTGRSNGPRIISCPMPTFGPNLPIMDPETMSARAHLLNIDYLRRATEAHAIRRLRLEKEEQELRKKLRRLTERLRRLLKETMEQSWWRRGLVDRYAHVRGRALAETSRLLDLSLLMQRHRDVIDQLIR